MKPKCPLPTADTAPKLPKKKKNEQDFKSSESKIEHHPYPEELTVYLGKNVCKQILHNIAWAIIEI